VTVSKALHLQITGMSKHGHQNLFFPSLKTTGILPVNHRASGKYGAYLIRFNFNPLIFPVKKIGTDSMPPVHGAPYDVVWIMLIKNVVLPFKKNHPIGIIHPACWWC